MISDGYSRPVATRSCNFGYDRYNRTALNYVSLDIFSRRFFFVFLTNLIKHDDLEKKKLFLVEPSTCC